MYKDELLRKYNLAKSKEYQAIKKEFLDFILRASTGSVISAEKLQGMLLLLNEPENWILNFEIELKKHKREKLNGS